MLVHVVVVNPHQLEKYGLTNPLNEFSEENEKEYGQSNRHAARLSFAMVVLRSTVRRKTRGEVDRIFGNTRCANVAGDCSDKTGFSYRRHPFEDRHF